MLARVCFQQVIADQTPARGNFRVPLAPAQSEAEFIVGGLIAPQLKTCHTVVRISSIGQVSSDSPSHVVCCSTSAHTIHRSKCYVSSMLTQKQAPLTLNL